MSNIFVVSDLHLGHSNVIKYEPIRLKKLAEFNSNCSEEEALAILSDKSDLRYDKLLSYHDDMVINAWNSVVKKDDIVFFLGDLCLTRNKEKISNWVSRLNGCKRMIMGNHDTCKPSFYIECGFEQVSKCPVLFNNHIFLSHEPLSHELIPEGCINFFGHVHSNTEFNWERGICVSIEHLKNFAPLNIGKYLKNDDQLADEWRHGAHLNQLQLDL